MKRKRLAAGAVGLAMVVGLVLAIGDTEARHRQRGKFRGELRITNSGSNLTRGTLIDTNGDGVTASLSILEGKSNLGAITTQAVAESPASPVSPTGACPGGDLEFPLVMGRSIIRIASGDLLFIRFDSGTVCVNPATGITTNSIEGSIVGGTGRFEGAAGPFEANATVRPLVSDPARHRFGAITSSPG